MVDIGIVCHSFATVYPNVSRVAVLQLKGIVPITITRSKIEEGHRVWIGTAKIIVV